MPTTSCPKHIPVTPPLVGARLSRAKDQIRARESRGRKLLDHFPKLASYPLYTSDGEEEKCHSRPKYRYIRRNGRWKEFPRKPHCRPKFAKTGSDLRRCTLTWTKYVLPRLFNDEQQCNIFDTMGIENPEIESPEYHQSIQNASQLLRELDDCGGTSLLVYCVEKSRDARHAFKSNYQLFHEVLYQRRVPIVMVVTCLEGEEVMEDWWERNRASLEASEIVVAGHACITTLKDEAKYEASREAVRELIRRHAAGTPVRGGWKKEGKVGAFMRRFLRQTSSEDKRLQDKLQKDLQAQCGMEPKLASKVANTFTYA